MSNFALLPRASNGETIEFAFAERPAIVRTHVVDRVKLPADVKQRDQTIFDFDQFATRIGKPGDRRDTNKIHHRLWLINRRRLM